MKINKFFAAALAATALFASCAKDGGNTPVKPNSGESRMGISFTLPTGAVTRAENVSGVGTENEVKNITVFIFDGSGNPVLGSATKFDVTVGASGNFTLDGNTYTLKAENEIKTTAGPRTIYIGANLPATDLTSASTEEMLQIKKLEMSNVVTEETIVMFSDKVSQTISTIGEIEGNEPTAAEITENANTVSADLKRIVSKVVVTSAAELTQEFEDQDRGEEVDVVYTVGKWGIHNSLSTTYAVEGTKTTGDYIGFTEGALSNTMPALGDVQTTTVATDFAYVAENMPKVYGDLTYALIQTTAAPDKVAKVDEGLIVWEDAGAMTDMWVVKSIDDKFFFCESDSDANAVMSVLDNEGSVKAHYPGCYVYFTVYLNHTGSDKAGAIARNEFIHTNITGIKTGNFFGGTPGAGDDGTEPQDPDEDPFDPNYPDEPIVKEDAFLTINVSVAPWAYDKVNVTLE